MKKSVKKEKKLIVVTFNTPYFISYPNLKKKCFNVNIYFVAVLNIRSFQNSGGLRTRVCLNYFINNICFDWLKKISSSVFTTPKQLSFFVHFLYSRLSSSNHILLYIRSRLLSACRIQHCDS